MKVFLSASVPVVERDQKYFDTADVFAIRDSVKALGLVLLERNLHLIFGGHPAITPLVRQLLREAGKSPRDFVTLYQSAIYQNEFPQDNAEFERIRIIDAVPGDRGGSLRVMREKMLQEKDIVCGIFIGGMDGVIAEFDMFRAKLPSVKVFPIASTGAAARIIYERYKWEHDFLEKELTYPTLFRRILPGS